MARGHSLNISHAGGIVVWAPSTLRWRNLKTQQSPVILDLCLRKTQEGKSHDHRDFIVFEKLRFHNVFRPHARKRKAGVFKFLRFKECFRKAPFSWRISVDKRRWSERTHPRAPSLKIYFRWLRTIALRIPSALDFRVISARTWAPARTKRKRFPSNLAW